MNRSESKTGLPRYVPGPIESEQGEVRRRLNLVTRAGCFVFISIMLFGTNHLLLPAQQLTTQAPPSSQSEPAGSATRTGLSQASAGELPNAPVDPVAPVDLVDSPGERYPAARIVPAQEADGGIPTIVADTQSIRGGIFTLDGGVVITYHGHTIEADHVEYDKASGDLEASGHLLVMGGSNHERIEASRASVNLETETGRFYDVKGSVGLKTSGKRLIYLNDNPFLFTGRLVIKTGPESYDIYDGTVTSCQLPNPDWLLSAHLFSLSGERATAKNSVFRLINVPVLYLPYVTHPVDSSDRQSGFLIPVFGQSSTKGLIVGEQVYLAINRSTDLTVGAEYFSSRGWSQSANFRYRGRDDNFVRSLYSGLLDRRVGIANQGGEDFLLSGRRDFTDHTRVVADIEYLSSFTYRAAFTENFNQAVSSDVISNGYVMHDVDGFEISGRADRYQGLKRIPVLAADGTLTPGQQVRIFHVPSLDLSSVDHALGRSGFSWDIDASFAGLKRVQPNFQTAGIVERYNLHPELSYRLGVGGWRLWSSLGARETFYSRGRVLSANPTPIQSDSGVNKSDVEFEVDLRPPVIEKTFSSGLIRRILRTDFKHTLEPSLTYRYVTGVNNFLSVLRFDDRDIASNTNELEYGITQRLFLRPRRTKPCPEVDTGKLAENPLLGTLPGGVADGSGDGVVPRAGCGTREWITWRLTQKYFLDPSFGGAVQTGRRNLFDSTLNFSGIAFLTEPRNISPLLSRLRVRASEKVDFEWDVDYDTGAKKLTASNVFVDVHEGAKFAGLSYARLNAPGRSFSEGISSAVSDFSQMRLLLGYGLPTKPGLSVAANAGLDLHVGSVQYAALQTSYNWNCCGFSVEYRKYELGSVRNENAYRFNFSLANIGTAGNLKRAERLF